MHLLITGAAGFIGFHLSKSRLATPSGDWSASDSDPVTSCAPYRVYNIGCDNPVNLLDYINAIEEAIGEKSD